MCFGGWRLLQERKHVIKIRYFRCLETGVTTKHSHILNRLHVASHKTQLSVSRHKKKHFLYYSKVIYPHTHIIYIYIHTHTHTRPCVALSIRVCIQYVCKHKLSARNGLLYLLRSASKSSRYTRPVLSRLVETLRDHLYRKDHNGSRAENVLTR